jgi:uncharacterized membrane protein
MRSEDLRFEFEEPEAKKGWWVRLDEWSSRMEDEHEGWFLLLHFPFMVALWIVGAVVSLAIFLFFKYFPYSWEIFAVLLGFWLAAGAYVQLLTIVEIYREDRKGTVFYGLLIGLAIFIYFRPWRQWL